MKRIMSVTYSGNDGRKPTIRLANNFLLKYGFTIGSKFDVEYQDGRIIINRKN